RNAKEFYVGSSIQFRIPNVSKQQARNFSEDNRQLGVEVKWFGSDNPSGFTSNHKSWQYVERQKLDQSDRILSGLFDLRLPLTFSKKDCSLLADIVADCAERVAINLHE
ncbi:MAG: aminotransferase, partial [Gammaproteobacteria bacterium]